MRTNLLPNQTALIEDIRDLVSTGYGALVTFEAPDAPWLEIAGPKGLGTGAGFFGAPVPTVRLCTNGGNAPLAVAAANRGFAADLDAIAERARPLVGDEFPALLALLAAVRMAAARTKPRMPTVGPALTEAGRPDFRAWMSCLPLADLQNAMTQALILPQAA